jgi:hypothetical protein
MNTKKIIAAGLMLAATTGTITACASTEEPDSYSEQGKSTQQVIDQDKKEKTANKALAALRKAQKAKDAKEAKANRWKTHMNQVSMGMSMSEVKAILGKPSDTDSSQSEFMGETTTMDSWTYGSYLDDTTWSLSFTDGKLDGKSRF